MGPLDDRLPANDGVVRHYAGLVDLPAVHVPRRAEILPHPSAPIEIIVTATDKDGGVATHGDHRRAGDGHSDADRPRSRLHRSAVAVAQLLSHGDSRRTHDDSDRAVVAQRSTCGDAASDDDDLRFVELRKATMRGEDDPTVYRLPLTVLDDLPNFLQRFPTVTTDSISARPS